MSELLGNEDLYDERAADEARETAEVESWTDDEPSNLWVGDSMGDALKQEEEERRLDNEASAARIAELERELEQLKQRTRLVVCLEGGIVQAINAQGPTDNVEVWVVDADAKEGDAELGEDGVYEHPDGGIVWAWKETRFDMLPEAEQDWLDRIGEEQS